MITFKQFLTEVANYPLYHGTNAYAMEKILYQNVLSTGFEDEDLHWPSKQGTIVSLTRSLNFAKNWKGGGGVVIELDRRKLATRYKIVPFNFFGTKLSGVPVPKARRADSDRYHPDFGGLDLNQYEEAVTKPIKNIKNYINAIHLSRTVKDEWVKLIEQNNIKVIRY